MDTDIALGTTEHVDDGTTVKRVQVVSGRGVWAYYLQNDPNRLHVIADIYYNRHAPHFAGQLRQAYTGVAPEERWLIIEGFVEPPREIRKYVEDEDEGLPRMERRE